MWVWGDWNAPVCSLCASAGSVRSADEGRQSGRYPGRNFYVDGIENTGEVVALGKVGCGLLQFSVLSVQKDSTSRRDNVSPMLEGETGIGSGESPAHCTVPYTDYPRNTFLYVSWYPCHVVCLKVHPPVHCPPSI